MTSKPEHRFWKKILLAPTVGAPRRVAACILATCLLALSPGRAAEVKVLTPVKGAEVWLVEDHTVPVVALGVSLPAGSAYDPPAKSGVAAMAAALLEEGAGSYDSESFHSALEDHDVELTADPGRDRLNVTMRVLPSDAKQASRMLGLALAKPHFDYDAITRARLSTMQGIDMSHEDPNATAWNAFHAFYFGAHAYGHPVEGGKGSVVAITREDLGAFARTHWVRGDAKLAIAGDVTPKEAAELARAILGGLPQRTVEPPPAPVMTGAPGLHVMAMDIPQPDAIFALPGLTRADPDFLCALVANTILGGAENSRLTRELREKRGLTYDISTDLVTYGRAGIVLGEIQAEKKNMRAALGLVRETLRKFAMEGPTRNEFEDAKSYLSGAFALGFTSNADIATTVLQFMEDGLPPTYLNRHAGLIGAIRYEDVKRVARRLYASEHLTIVVAGSLPKDKHSSNPFRN